MDLRDMGGVTNRRMSGVAGMNPMAALKAKAQAVNKAVASTGPAASNGNTRRSGSEDSGSDDEGEGGGEEPPPLPLAQRMQARAKPTARRSSTTKR
jgi:hypothetical protein